MATKATARLRSLELAHSLLPVLKAISDEYRLAILLTLSEESKTVVELTNQLGIAQPLVSHHLKALRDVGLIVVTPEGRSNRYSICCDAVDEPIQLLSRIAILLTLSEESKTVVELTDQLGIAQPLVSHHLKALRDVGLIVVTPEGRSNRYSICCDAVKEPIQLLSSLASAAPSN